MSTPETKKYFMLTNVRLSFPALFTAEAIDDGEEKYGASFLIDPSDPQCAKIEAEIDRVGKEKFKEKWTAIRKSIGSNNQQICWWDGDTKAYDGYAGMKVLTARRSINSRPVVIDRDKSPLAQSDGKPYAGCYVNAKLQFWAQDNQWGKTVRCELVGVQFNRDGDAFSASTPATDEGFEDLGSDEGDPLTS